MDKIPSADCVLEMLIGDISINDVGATDESNSSELPEETSKFPILKTEYIDAAIASKNASLVQKESVTSKNLNQHEARIQELENQLKEICKFKADNDDATLSSEIAEIISSSDRHSSPENMVKRNIKRAKFQKLKQVKEIDKGTYLSLVKELENEREARWKAEQAAKKLIKMLKATSTENTQRKSVQGSMVEASERLKQMLIKEREETQGLKIKIKECEHENLNLTNILNQKNEIQQVLEDRLKQMKEKFDRLKMNFGKKESTYTQSCNNYERKSMTLKSKIEELTTKNLGLQDQIKKVQQLLIEREQEHRTSIEHHFTLDSPEFQNALSKEINKNAEHHQKEVQCLEKSILTCQSNYKQLENEFREALYVEAERYSSLLSAFKDKSESLEGISTAHKCCKEKETKTKSLIQELTSIAKEQKVKLSEVSKCKSQMESHFKERISNLELQNEKYRKCTAQLEIIREEKSKLLSQVSMLQSNIDGLKDERKLWGQELAQQGVNLSKDRGRLESKIEAQNMEIASLRRQNLADLDSLKIKSKMTEDQTDTIRKLKDALKEKDDKIKDVQDDMMGQHRKLEQDVEDLVQENAAYKEKITHLLKRKEELKNENCDVQDELEKLQNEHSKLVKKWAEKGQVLSQVESHVKKLKESFDAKQEKIKLELQVVVQEKVALTRRMERIDEEFQKQLDMIKMTHDGDIGRLKSSKNQEINDLQNKVLSLEEEMREILRDAERQKQTMQQKLHKATAAFKDLHEGLS